MNKYTAISYRRITNENGWKRNTQIRKWSTLTHFFPRLKYEDGNDDDTADTGKSIFSYTHTYYIQIWKWGKSIFYTCQHFEQRTIQNEFPNKIQRKIASILINLKYTKQFFWKSWPIFNQKCPWKITKRNSVFFWLREKNSLEVRNFSSFS